MFVKIYLIRLLVGRGISNRKWVWFGWKWSRYSIFWRSDKNSSTITKCQSCTNCSKWFFRFVCKPQYLLKPWFYLVLNRHLSIDFTGQGSVSLQAKQCHKVVVFMIWVVYVYVLPTVIDTLTAGPNIILQPNQPCDAINKRDVYWNKGMYIETKGCILCLLTVARTYLQMGCTAYFRVANVLKEFIFMTLIFYFAFGIPLQLRIVFFSGEMEEEKEMEDRRSKTWGKRKADKYGADVTEDFGKFFISPM